MLNLDVDDPDKVADILRRAAEFYRASGAELRSAWQDPNLKVWDHIAVVLERAAKSVDKTVNKYK